MTTRYEAYLARKRAEFGDRFDTSDLAPAFVEWFNSEERVKVIDIRSQMTACGLVTVTTGWKPTFLLKRKVTDYGSSYVISADWHQVIAVKRDGRYLPLARLREQESGS